MKICNTFVSLWWNYLLCITYFCQYKYFVYFLGYAHQAHTEHKFFEILKSEQINMQ